VLAIALEADDEIAVRLDERRDLPARL